MSYKGISDSNQIWAEHKHNKVHVLIEKNALKCSQFNIRQQNKTSCVIIILTDTIQQCRSNKGKREK